MVRLVGNFCPHLVAVVATKFQKNDVVSRDFFQMLVDYFSPAVIVQPNFPRLQLSNPSLWLHISVAVLSEILYLRQPLSYSEIIPLIIESPNANNFWLFIPIIFSFYFVAKLRLNFDLKILCDFRCPFLTKSVFLWRNLKYCDELFARWISSHRFLGLNMDNNDENFR